MQVTTVRNTNTITANRILKKQLAPMSGIHIYQKYGVTRKQLHSLCLNLFHFPAQYMDCLSSYYLKHWTGKYLSDSVVDGTVLDNATEYMVVYQGCTPYQAKKAQQVRLSFRKPKDDFNIPAYVIVRILGE